MRREREKKKLRRKEERQGSERAWHSQQLVQGPEIQGAWLKSSMTEACQSKGKKIGHQAGGATRIQPERGEPDPEPWQVKDAEMQG